MVVRRVALYTTVLGNNNKKKENCVCVCKKKTVVELIQ